MSAAGTGDRAVEKQHGQGNAHNEALTPANEYCYDCNKDGKALFAVFSQDGGRPQL